jgi:hypothetical protein
MAKEKTKEVKTVEIGEVAKEPVISAPVIATPVIQIQPENEFKPYEGEYHMVKVDDKGNDIPGSDFSLHPTTFERGGYGKLSNFRVKKSPKQ